MITAIADGAVSLYYDNTKRIETVTAGAKVTGNLEVTGTITGSGGSFLPLAGGTMTGTLTTKTLLPDADATYDVGSTSKTYDGGEPELQAVDPATHFREAGRFKPYSVKGFQTSSCAANHDFAAS